MQHYWRKSEPALVKLSASWLQHHLKSFNFDDAKVVTGFTFRPTEYEVDVFCFDPLVVLECTSYVKETPKIQKLVEVQNLLKSEQNRAYLVTYEIEPKIKKEVLKIANDNNITLIDASIEII